MAGKNIFSFFGTNIYAGAYLNRNGQSVVSIVKLLLLGNLTEQNLGKSFNHIWQLLGAVYYKFLCNRFWKFWKKLSLKWPNDLMKLTFSDFFYFWLSIPTITYLTKRHSNNIFDSSGLDSNNNILGWKRPLQPLSRFCMNLHFSILFILWCRII